MRKWFGDRLDTAVAVFWPQWRRLHRLAITIAGAGAFTWATAYLGEFNIHLTDEPVWPWWARLIAALFGLATLVLIDYTTKLRLDLMPQVQIGVAPVDNMILKHPVEAGGWMESLKRVVNGKITGLAQGSPECEAHLTAIRYQRAVGDSWEPVPEFASFALQWARHDEPRDTVPKGVTKYFRIVQAHQDDSRLYVPGAQEIALLRRLFVDPGKYELDIVVTAEKISENMTVEITYSGSWDDLAAVEKAQAA
jgi:hypothetical protein